MPLPPFSASATVTGRTVAPALFAGKKGLLVVHGARNGEVGKDLSKKLRAKHPDFKAVPYASIVDLRAFSGLWRKVAEAQLKQTYEKLATRAKEAGADPADAVIIVPDWEGAIAQALGVESPDKDPMAFVVGDGKILGVLPAAQADAALALLA